MNRSLLVSRWPSLVRAILALPFAIAIWIPFMFGSLELLRPVVAFVSQLFLDQTINALIGGGSLEWTLQTNLAFANNPSQLYELPIQPQYFLLPFPLVWAGVWASAPRQSRAASLLKATLVTLGAVLVPLLLEVLSAPAYAAHSVGLNAIVTHGFDSRAIVRSYHPVSLVIVQLMAFARTVAVYFNLFALPSLISLLSMETAMSSRSQQRRVKRLSDNSKKNARRAA